MQNLFQFLLTIIFTLPGNIFLLQEILTERIYRLRPELFLYFEPVSSRPLVVLVLFITFIPIVALNYILGHITLPVSLFLIFTIANIVAAHKTPVEKIVAINFPRGQRGFGPMEIIYNEKTWWSVYTPETLLLITFLTMVASFIMLNKITNSIG